MISTNSFKNRSLESDFSHWGKVCHNDRKFSLFW